MMIQENDKPKPDPPNAPKSVQKGKDKQEAPEPQPITDWASL